LNVASNLPAAPDAARAASTDSEHAFPADAVEVGRVLDAYGVKGWIKVQAYSSDGDAVFTAKRWFLRASSDSKAPPRPAGVVAARIPASIKVLAVREHGEGIVAQVEGYVDRNGAESLRGAAIFISRSEFPQSSPDEYYWVDLIGLDVINRQGESLGKVLGLLDTGPHSVLRIAPPGLVEPLKPDQERLVPFVGAFVDQVDLAAKQIRVDWGLDY
jgi:16S rRNA processing protein RimM